MIKKGRISEKKQLFYEILMDTRVADCLGCDLSDGYKEAVLLSSISLIRRQLPGSALGWPLLRRRTGNDSKRDHGEQRRRSVAEWIVNLASHDRTVVEHNMTDKSSSQRARTGSQAVEDSRSERAGRYSEDESFSLLSGCHQRFPSSSSIPSKEWNQSTPGWPLLRVRVPEITDSLSEYEVRNMSVVQWVMNLPSRSTLATQQTQMALPSINTETSVQDDPGEDWPIAPRRLPEESELSPILISQSCKQFTYAELKQATSGFSSENLIGEGGCSYVYKGCLPNGKQVAVKILKPYKEAWDDFQLEVGIITSLKHKHIAPLIGICIEDGGIISVYDFFPKGSLEENLHGAGQKTVFPWEGRFNVAVAIAEALNYLHNECSQPVIHRDVKSSNILLSYDFLPQLSDFGLAIWGPATSTHLIHSDVVGTFGYIAPEYFMHGRVSDKVDVYSFGVVLLELLSGRRPINRNVPKGQESLVKWARALLDSGDIKELLDPKLDENYDITQVHRMVLAARLCINPSARYRSRASQILKILRGDKRVDSNVNDLKEISDEEDEELLDELNHKQQLDLSVLDSDDDISSLNSVDTTSVGSMEQKHNFKFKYFLEKQQD